MNIADRFLMNKHRPVGYHRYHIETKSAPNLVPHPHRFNVKVKKLNLAKLLISELFHLPRAS